MPWHFGKSVFYFLAPFFPAVFKFIAGRTLGYERETPFVGNKAHFLCPLVLFGKVVKNIHKIGIVLSKHWILQEQSLQCTCCWGLLRFVWCQPPPPPPGLDWTRTNFIAVSDPAKTGAESAFVNWGKLFFAAESFQHFFFKSGGKKGQSSNKLHPCAELSYIIFNIYSW